MNMLTHDDDNGV